MKHRTVEKTVQRCEMSIVNGPWSQAGGGKLREDQRELETRLIVRLDCQHGLSGLLHYAEMNWTEIIQG